MSPASAMPVCTSSYRRFTVVPGVVLGEVRLLAFLLPQPASAQVGAFEDLASESGQRHTFADEAEWLADHGITRGCNPPKNDRFCPDQPVTRGQMAAFLTRTLHLPKGDVVFSDTAGHIFEADIAALASAGVT